jgi:hypothetical protein
MKTYGLILDNERRYVVGVESFQEAGTALQAWAQQKGSYTNLMLLSTELPSPISEVAELLKKEGKL